MKAIQITIDEGLLSRFDADAEVKRAGRSAVLRRAIDAYLRARRKRLVSDAYRRAYQRVGPGGTPGGELEGWTEEGVWPEA
jgi:metal-responsive CopG/Arc/MetJ family transcriptional regulator